MAMPAASETTKIDISSGTIFRVILIVIGWWFLYLIIDLLVMLFAAVVVASAIRPVADFLQRYRLPRAGSVLLVYALVLLLFSSVVTLMIPPLTEQTVQLAHALPQLFDRLGAAGMTAFAGDGDVLASLQRILVGAGDNLANVGANILQRTRTLFSGAFTVLFVFVIALYLVVDRDALNKPFRLVVPSVHLAYTERVIDRAQRYIGRWVVAQLSLAVIIGVVVSVGLWLIGVPYALVLGLLAGAFEVVPVIGPIAAAVPAVLIGFSQSWLLGLGVLLFYVLVQQAENNLLIPIVMRKATGLNPLITILAVLLGARLGGIVGVILAVPAAVVLSTIFTDMVGRSAEQELAG
ncbi:MAG: AI-2E family transporter [Candidatus Andersenbacteria bacterium]|nr:AI-2E family transporter [Candidatus Andersenbacteria bacterium]